MNKKIQTYQDLLDEKDKLEVLLKAQKDLLRLDMHELRNEFRPAIRVVRVMGKMFSREKDRSLLGAGADRLVDIVFQRIVLNKAGWVARFVVPILVKNLSSHVIAENKQHWLHKLRSWVGKKHHNGKTPPDPNPGVSGSPSQKGQ